MVALDVIVNLLASITKREYKRAVSAIRAAVPSTRWYVDAALAGEKDRAAMPDYLATVLFSSLIVGGLLRKGVPFHALDDAHSHDLGVLGVRVLFDGEVAQKIPYDTAAGNGNDAGRLVLIHKESRQHWLLVRATTLGDVWVEASGMELTTQRETNEIVYMHMSLHVVDLEPLPTCETHYVVRVGERTDRHVPGRDGPTRRGTGYAYRIPYVEFGEPLHRMDAKGVEGLLTNRSTSIGSGAREYVIDAPGMLGFGSVPSPESIVDEVALLILKLQDDASAVVVQNFMAALRASAKMDAWFLFLFIRDLTYLWTLKPGDLWRLDDAGFKALWMAAADSTKISQVKMEQQDFGSGAAWENPHALWEFVRSSLVSTEWREMHALQNHAHEVLSAPDPSDAYNGPFGMCVLLYIASLLAATRTTDIFNGMIAVPYSTFAKRCKCSVKLESGVPNTPIVEGIKAMLESGAVHWLSAEVRVELAQGVVRYITGRDPVVKGDADHVHMALLIRVLRADASQTLHAEIASVVLQLYSDDAELVWPCSRCSGSKSKCERCERREGNVKLHRKAVADELLHLGSGNRGGRSWTFFYALVVVMGLSGRIQSDEWSGSYVFRNRGLMRDLNAYPKGPPGSLNAVVGKKLLVSVWSCVSNLQKRSPMLTDLVRVWLDRIDADLRTHLTSITSLASDLLAPSDAALAALFVRSRLRRDTEKDSVQDAYARELCAQIDVDGGYFDVACVMASQCKLSPMAVVRGGFPQVQLLLTSARSIGAFQDGEGDGDGDKASRVVAYLHKMACVTVSSLRELGHWIKKRIGHKCEICDTEHAPVGLGNAATFALCDGVVYIRDESDRLVLVSNNMGAVVDMMPSSDPTTNTNTNTTSGDPNCVYFVGNVAVDAKSKKSETGHTVADKWDMENDVTLLDGLGWRVAEAGGVCVIRVPDAMDLTEKLTRFLMHDAKPLVRLSRAAGVVSTRVTYVCAYGAAELKQYYGLLGDAASRLTNTSVLNRIHAAVVVVDDVLAKAIDRLQTRKTRYASGPLAAMQLVEDLCGLRAESADLDLLTVVAFAYERVEFNQSIHSLVPVTEEPDATKGVAQTLMTDFTARTQNAVKHACTALGRSGCAAQSVSFSSIYGGMDVYGVTEVAKAHVRRTRSLVIAASNSVASRK
jgi:hypothetical protein